ncbi:MAG: cupin domain-containing protein [Defluviicoccus sp.]|nr:cupin domain-containing protein [Defluviicoccus sp.]
MSGPAGQDGRADADLIAALEAARIHPLWDRYKTITPVLPDAPDEAAIWRWREIEPFAERAASEVGVEDVERRALILCHPAFGGETVTTGNLIAAFTVLEPGDRAVPHRHTASAIRFATRSEGAVTIVNGRRCAMLDGDLVLTPPMCWHGHINEGEGRTVWFDAANIPLVNALHANFFEPGSRADNAFWDVGEGDERLWQEAGLQAEGHGRDAGHSPKYRYPGAATRRLLDAAPAGEDGAKTVRYVNPVDGGPVMASLDCQARRLTAGGPTRPRRSLCSQICLAVSGSGRSAIGEETIEWSRHDVFTIPQWTWARHEALDGDADLFVVSDRPVREGLELMREELG